MSLNKKLIEDKIKAELHKKTNATISLNDVNVSFLHTFPFISLQLSKVIVRDSLWNTHKHDLLNAEKIYGVINPFNILFGKNPFRKIVVENGILYLFSDSTGYSNIHIFHNQTEPDKKSDEDYPDLEGNNMELIVEKKLHDKLFDIQINRFNSSLKKVNNVLLFDANLNLLVHNMIFKQANGSFLNEKKISGKCKVQFNLLNKILAFENIILNIDNHPFLFSGKFFTAVSPTPYELNVKTNDIHFKQAVSLLSDNIRKKLDQYNIDKTINLEATLDGSDPLMHSPVMHIFFNADNATVTTPLEVFSKSFFKGSFFNRANALQAPQDENSILRFNNFSGTTENITLQSDSIIFTNLIQPTLSCNLHSQFEVESLNNLFDSKNIEFKGGTAKLDVVYKGPIENGDSINADISGNIAFDSTSIKYLPKNFLLSDGSGKLQFSNKDVLIENLIARTGSTQLKMNGGIKNLMALIDKNPEKLFLDWNIFSPKLNLHDFRMFIGKNAASYSHKKTKRFFTKQVSQIDSLLNACDVHVQIKANELLYKKFVATNIKASVVLKNNTIMLDSASLNNSGGSLIIGGFVKTEIENSLNVHAVINNMDVDKMLFSFGDFGQDAINQKNIKGKIKADVNFFGVLNPEQEIIPSSIKGNAEFSLKNGELIDFESVQNISKKVFKNRNFSDIHFAELKDRFDINGSAIKMNRMEIESAVITLFIEGTYDAKKGTDISIQVPLSNLKAKKEDTIPANKGIKSNNGISVRLRAKTGDDGKLKITWDPFKKALKNIKKKEAESEK